MPPVTISWAECQEGNHAPSIRRTLRVDVLKAINVIRTEFINGRLPRRDLVYKAGVPVRDPGTLESGQVFALCMQLGGEENRERCGACRAGHPFVQCVRSSMAGNGECAGCKWYSSPGRCEHRK
ncbi:hypothetical protein KEM55_000739 [Ascosphaera atra]|nr:hypothetical protein KEM55_000739 [Ascosphaera atra]